MLAARPASYKGLPYMPLNLKGVLLRHGLRHIDLGKAIRQSNGSPLSETTISLLLNRGKFPMQTPMAWVKEQTKQWLLSKGVSEEEMADMWEVDEADQYRNGHPVGVHLGQRSGSGFRKPIVPDFEPMEVVMLSPAAKRAFRFFRDPFSDEINGPDDIYTSDDQRYVSEAMYQTAKHGGFLAVVGESGSGKSTLRKMLVERLKDVPVRLVFPQTIDKTKLTTGSICSAIINDLSPGIKVKIKIEDQARQVQKILLESARSDYMHVLLIEEAHDLSIATLKYLKRFYELEDGFRKLLSIILIGQPELKDKLDERRYPEAREVIRRIEIAELQPIGPYLEAYLAHKFRRQNVDVASVIDPSAYDAIRERWTRRRQGVQEISMLYPLMIGNTITRAMNRAAELRIDRVTADLIREV